MTIESMTVVGVSSTRSDAFANRVVRKAYGVGIGVYAVNPKMKSMQVRGSGGTSRRIPVYDLIGSVPEATQYIFLYIPRPSINEDIMRQISTRGYGRIVIPPTVGAAGEDIEFNERIRKLGDDHLFFGDDLQIGTCFLKGDVK